LLTFDLKQKAYLCRLRQKDTRTIIIEIH